MMGLWLPIAEPATEAESWELASANHVTENGIDDWIGGVHLSSEGTVIFRDGDSLLLADNGLG